MGRKKFSSQYVTHYTNPNSSNQGSNSMELNYDSYLSQLKSDDVFNSDGKLFEFKTIVNAFNTAFISDDISYLFNQHCKAKKVDFTINSGKDWFDKGVECKILQAGSNGWKKGKLKINISVEFIPDEPETNQYQSPLDEIRQEIQQNGGV